MNWIAWTFDRMLEASWQGAAMVILVLLAEMILRQRLSARWRCGLWMLVFLRLCLPVLPASPMSLANLVRDPDSSPRVALPSNSETVIFGVIPDHAPNAIVSHIAPKAAPPTARVRWNFACAFAWIAIVLAFVTGMLVRCVVLEWRISRLDSTSNPRLIGALRRAKQEASITRSPHHRDIDREWTRAGGHCALALTDPAGIGGPT